jgi:hypothetical protein
MQLSTGEEFDVAVSSYDITSFPSLFPHPLKNDTFSPLCDDVEE